MLLARPLSRDDVMGVYAGLRPLLAGESDSTSKLSREHAVATPVPGLITVAGGKYTTYRVMAADAVDVAVRELAGVPGGVSAAAAATPSVTAEVPLLGADGYRALWNTRSRLAEESGLACDWVEHLLNRSAISANSSAVSDPYRLSRCSTQSVERPDSAASRDRVFHSAR